MSWGAQNRSKDAKTPSVARALSDKPELDRCPIQPYCLAASDTRLDKRLLLASAAAAASYA
jgi:hypothetical protein